MKWFKNLLAIASVYSLSAGLIYFSILPSDPRGWETQSSQTASLWLAVPITILTMFIWSKLSKKFNLD